MYIKYENIIMFDKHLQILRKLEKARESSKKLETVRESQERFRKSDKA